MTRSDLDIALEPTGIVGSTTTSQLGEENEEGSSERDLNTTRPAQGTTVVEALSHYPDGGFDAWLMVACSSSLLAVAVGGIYSWGVMQDALTGLGSTGTIAYIGSVQATFTGLLAIPCARLVASFGPRPVALAGTVLCFLGPLTASFVTTSFVGLFILEGVVWGVGAALIFPAAATLPSSYFLKRRNLATGITYGGGGVGGAGFSLLSSVLLNKLGIPWALRITAFLYLALTLPPALVLKSRFPLKPFRSGPVVEWSLFKNPTFLLLFFGAAIALFPLFVPPFFLPLFASSLGLSSLTGSLLLAGFNLASAAGRIICGLGADRLLGSTNAQILCLFASAITTFIIWPLATSLPPLAIFAVVNGFAAGGFFSLMPGVVSGLFGSSRLSSVFGAVLTSFFPGYFLGGPIAGFILSASGGSEKGVAAFRPAIFYSGALTVVSCGLILAARITASKELRKRI
ncbi:putative monocarboxylate transporter [Mycena albidolilacea]|uniref:Monocarboxylate transporter n=1 Tax=Mycena albidolilacea TaxID=1033008 RepID=A0AAD7ARX0_9AGAR|nr:putative monocarboxylate transporter [Mycena albidolilacea]